MRSAILLTACLLLAALPAAQPVPWRPEPFVPVGVSYPSELSRDRERATADLEAIYTLGFNSIRVPIEWADAEPARGQYRFDALDQTLELAGQAGLKVVLQLDTESMPAWLLRRYPDGRFVPVSRPEGPRPQRACLDHPGVRADVEAYVAAASARAARHPAWQAFDIGSELENGFCVCPHTERRFREWLKATFGSDARPAALAASDRAAFVALERRDHLALVAGAAAARGGRFSSSSASAPSVLQHLIYPRGEPPGQDDWLMTTVVDHYGTLVPPELTRVASLPAAQLAFALDGIRSAARDKGWLMTDRTVTGRTAQVPSAADLRLWTWAALSRGARGVTYADWRASGPSASRSLVGPDGTISDRARAAGGLARVIGRNPALFAPLRPRAAKVAIAYDPRPLTDGSGPMPAATAFQANIYRALFERNIQVDFIHLDEIAAGMASRYNVVFVGSESTLPTTAADALKAYVAAGGSLVDGSTTSPTDQQVVQIAARAGVTPEVRIEGATGPVETRFLESSDVLMLVGLNHADTPQRVKMTFTPDTQEAIWQNMETGSAVNFIAGPEGPAYTYSFGPRDALVLMIRKSVR
jgi:beta-galactosidase